MMGYLDHTGAAIDPATYDSLLLAGYHFKSIGPDLQQFTPAEEAQLSADIAADELRLLEKATARKQAEIEAAYKAAYSAVLVSSALGSPHTYITDEEGEKHLMGWAACKRPRNVWCDDGTGYAWKLHTAAQTEQVLNDGADIKEAAWNNRITKLAEVSTILADLVLTNAEKVAAIEAVTW